MVATAFCVEPQLLANVIDNHAESTTKIHSEYLETQYLERLQAQYSREWMVANYVLDYPSDEAKETVFELFDGLGRLWRRFGVKLQTVAAFLGSDFVKGSRAPLGKQAGLNSGEAGYEYLKTLHEELSNHNADSDSGHQKLHAFVEKLFRDDSRGTILALETLIAATATHHDYSYSCNLSDDEARDFRDYLKSIVDKHINSHPYIGETFASRSNERSAWKNHQEKYGDSANPSRLTLPVLCGSSTGATKTYLVASPDKSAEEQTYIVAAALRNIPVKDHVAGSITSLLGLATYLLTAEQTPLQAQKCSHSCQLQSFAGLMAGAVHDFHSLMEVGCGYIHFMSMEDKLSYLSSSKGSYICSSAAGAASSSDLSKLVSRPIGLGDPKIARESNKVPLSEFDPALFLEVSELLTMGATTRHAQVEVLMQTIRSEVKPCDTCHSLDCAAGIDLADKPAHM
jgi:hypothetical protein